MKKAVFFLWGVIGVLLAGTTFVEKYWGMAYVHEHVYGSWWFVALWGIAVGCSLAYAVRRRLYRNLPVFLLHMAFVVILAGALLTFWTARRGTVHLRVEEPVCVFMAEGEGVSGLPFAVTLDTFFITYHAGTSLPADYTSVFTVCPAGEECVGAKVAMNRIFSFRGYRFYQTSYDSDGYGSVLTVNYDPWGIPFTYTGYFLLFLAMCWNLGVRNGYFRRAWRCFWGEGEEQRGDGPFVRGRFAVWVERGFVFLLRASLGALTFYIGWRVYASGRLPVGNGYETMLLLAWVILAVAVVLAGRVRWFAPAGLLLAGLCLLSAAIAGMNTQVTPLVPVLASPLLSWHVSFIIMAYALLSLIFVNGVLALVFAGGNKTGRIGELLALSRLFLVPALFLLGMGIFIGAVWANVSWGRYWAWDAKEVWALITFLVYAFALHTGSCPMFRKPVFFHVYMVCAFFTVLMTYFGVNYFLGGLHSYAG